MNPQFSQFLQNGQPSQYFVVAPMALGSAFPLERFMRKKLKHSKKLIRSNWD